MDTDTNTDTDTDTFAGASAPAPAPGLDKGEEKERAKAQKRREKGWKQRSRRLERMLKHPNASVGVKQPFVHLQVECDWDGNSDIGGKGGKGGQGGRVGVPAAASVQAFTGSIAQHISGDTLGFVSGGDGSRCEWKQREKFTFRVPSLTAPLKLQLHDAAFVDDPSAALAATAAGFSLKNRNITGGVDIDLAAIDLGVEHTAWHTLQPAQHWLGNESDLVAASTAPGTVTDAENMPKKERRKIEQAAVEARETLAENAKMRERGIGEVLVAVHCIAVPMCGVLPESAEGSRMTLAKGVRAAGDLHSASASASTAAPSSVGVSVSPDHCHMHLPQISSGGFGKGGFGIDAGPFFFPLPKINSDDDEGSGGSGGSGGDSTANATATASIEAFRNAMRGFKLRVEYFAYRYDARVGGGVGQKGELWYADDALAKEAAELAAQAEAEARAKAEAKEASQVEGGDYSGESEEEYSSSDDDLTEEEAVKQKLEKIKAKQKAKEEAKAEAIADAKAKAKADALAGKAVATRKESAPGPRTYAPVLAEVAHKASLTPTPAFVGQVELSAYDLLRFDGEQELFDLMKKPGNRWPMKQEGHGDAGLELCVCNVTPAGDLLL
jgi:hypothetical protein